jgi:Peptidase family M1 domain
LKKLLLFFFIFLAVSTFAQQKYWQQETNYNIAVTLNDVDNTLDGFETIEYINNSPDTLNFIWIHLWPNAYKNDRTAFSDQQLENGNTDFYFSEENKKGYINRLNFKIDNVSAFTEDHPQHQDIIKLILPQPLAPSKKMQIETPFHVKLPYVFSRGGHVEQSYQITQWYPKPAVYDKDGWHEMPYLDQGEFYSEFGSFDVKITLPQNYLVAATGELQNEDEKNWLKKFVTIEKVVTFDKKQSNILVKSFIPSAKTNKTLHYKQDNIHDFAWFADKTFLVKYDTLQLTSGKIIDAFSFVLPANKALWANSNTFIKKSIVTKSKWLGEYPYSTVSVVDNSSSIGGGMEYPMVTIVNAGGSEEGLEAVINHEIGHNWFYGILATNERKYPWMDEGMNTYYDKRYEKENSNKKSDRNVKGNTLLKKLIPDNIEHIILETYSKLKKDQPVNTSSERLSALNYGLISYVKMSEWMEHLEKKLGTEVFDLLMQGYFSKWKFKHPQPSDFKEMAEKLFAKKLDSIFSLIDKKGSMEPIEIKKIRFTTLFNLKETNKYNYISIAPLLGYNKYDKFMLGGLLHNYSLPLPKLQFSIAPLYSFNSKKINGIGQAHYNIYKDNFIEKIKFGFNYSNFSSNYSLDTANKKIFESFKKLVPSITVHFNHPIRSKIKSYIDARSFLFEENNFTNFSYKNGSDSIINYPNTLNNTNRFVNQLTFGYENNRVLYPHNYKVQLQQGKGFYRINLTGNYFFNYTKFGGLNARFFTAIFNYVGVKDFSAFAYQPKLLANNGNDDYTNSSYFIGRSASSSFGEIPVKNGGIAAQQISIENSGGLKMRLDQYSSIQGYSEKWIASINLTSTVPEKLFPFRVPLKLFFDAGTYAEAWNKSGPKQRVLYVGGLQLSIFKNLLNINVPLAYSKAFKDQLITDKVANKLSRKITFSIDIKQLKISNIFPQINF